MIVFSQEHRSFNCSNTISIHCINLMCNISYCSKTEYTICMALFKGKYIIQQITVFNMWYTHIFTILIPGFNRYIGYKSPQSVKDLMVKWLCSWCCEFQSCWEHFLIYICSMTLSRTWRNGKTQVYFQPRLSNQNLTNILHTTGYNFTCYTNIWVQFPCQNLTSLTPKVFSFNSFRTVCAAILIICGKHLSPQ